ncbi:uncharacterized protein LOC120254027 [Dioscorea cayenensis subsp. rotundata]|uniref:Uncharacterized protein LOC120254027 n=1 Tax=Dioscorea cayennensis subsp. rotundata TaxID=55577 RepID=A0AB40ATG4_DIOCR|nr:uncharacterized protein LOC120254027 [Dioscorea cayenensis subsp. rotundata]
MAPSQITTIGIVIANLLWKLHSSSTFVSVSRSEKLSESDVTPDCKDLILSIPGLMDMFYTVVKYKGEGCVLDLTILSGWELLLEEICTYWHLQASSVKVKYIISDEQKTVASISSEDDFQTMCNIHWLFKINVVDMLVETVDSNTEDNSGSSRPSETLSMLPPVLHGGPLTISNPTRDSEAEFTMIGHRFENAKAFKDALCDLAVKRNFNFRFIKNDKDRVTVTCADEDCQWRVHASRDGNLPTFRIKTAQHEHTCGGGINTPFHPRASKKWVSRKVVMKLRDRPLYRAVDIQRDILRDHGVRLPYKQAWMGKELAKGILHGSDIASYDLLVWYAAKVSETNPGSVVIIDTDGERFKRGFFCFRASLDGFKRGCRPMLFLDGTHLLGKYGGILLGATAKDGNEGFFHLAFAIVDNETNDN